MPGADVPSGTVGHLLMRGENVTRGYFDNPEANAAAITADGWLRTGDLALEHDGELYVTGRSKEIIFVNGQNYYPHDLEAVLQAEPGLELGKVIAAGRARRRRRRRTNSCCSCCTAATWPISCRSRRAPCTSSMSTPASRSRASCRSSAFRRRPAASCSATRSRKAYEDGEFAAEIAEFDRAWAAAHGHGRAAKGRIERQLKAIVDDAMPGKHVDVDDNLFDVGASSLTLIQVHEKIDELYPGAVDLTELFDYPTISQLAKHLEKKLQQSG